jgi:predicted ATPase
MNATVAWSYQLLGPNEQRVFRCLGVLAGRFPVEAAATVTWMNTDSATDARGVNRFRSEGAQR